jgi:hypothetical protein
MIFPVNYNLLSWKQRKEVREQYIRDQGNLCYHCKASLFDKPSDEVLAKKIHPWLFPQNFFGYPVHLHHHHKTGMTIGAVHCRCNAVLWEYHQE